MQKKGQSSTSIYNIYFHNGWLNAAFHQKYAPAGEKTAGNPISGGTRKSENDDRPGNFATRLVRKNQLVFTNGKACPLMDTQSLEKRGHLSLFGSFSKTDVSTELSTNENKVSASGHTRVGVCWFLISREPQKTSTSVPTQKHPDNPLNLGRCTPTAFWIAGSQAMAVRY
ncbi:MAG TPA: hypothetical protein VJA94_01395 [Candidatus Angelobacter sp.]